MAEYPDINKPDDIAKHLANVQVLGGYSRSFTLDPSSGEETVDRYVERLGDYVSDHALRFAIEHALRRTHAVAGLDGVITAMSADEITLSYADGSEATFARVKQATGDE